MMIEPLYLVFILLAALALGQRILAKINFANGLERFIFSFPLGLAVLAYIALLLGALGLLYKWIVISIISAIFLIFILDIKKTAISFFSYIKKIDIKKIYSSLGPFHSFLVFIIFLLALLNLVMSFSPPWHFDVLTYHLAIQKIYIDAHSLAYLPYLFYSNLPQVIDTMYLVGLIVNNAILAHLIAYSLGITAVLAIFSFCRRFFDAKIGILASLIFFSAPMVTEGFSIAHIDLPFTLIVFLALYALFAYMDSDKVGWLVLASIFTGLSVSSKIFGAVAAIGISALLLYHLIVRLSGGKIGLKKVFLALLLFGAVSFLIVLPWMAKAYAHTNNPVWPLFNSVFDGKYWDEKHSEDLGKRELVRELTIANYLRIPWDVHTQAGKDKGNILEHEGLGPFFLAFIPLYFILRRKKEVINYMLFFILISLSMWFFISQEFRHAIFVLPLVAIISSYVISEISRNKIVSKIIMALLLFTFAFNLAVWFGGNLKEIPVALGMESKESYYMKNPGAIYEASMFINNDLPEDAKILLFRDTRGYFIDREYVWADPLLQAYLDYSQIEDEEEYYAKLKEIGITHILVNNEFDYGGFIVNEYRYNERILGMMDKTLQKHAVKVHEYGEITVSELK